MWENKPGTGGEGWMLGEQFQHSVAATRIRLCLLKK